MKFLYFKTKTEIVNKVPLILEIISESISITKYFNDEYSLTIYYNFSNIRISELATILVSELFEDISIYESLTYKSETKMIEAVKIVSELLSKNYIKDNYVNNKIILLKLKDYTNEKLKKLILNSYYNDSDMIYTIKTFLENNQNVSTASDILYLHRNTLNQRLTKFEENTNFNVKNFIDGYLIYSIIK